MRDVVEIDSVEQTLNQLSLTFSARDIMTPGADLISANTLEETALLYQKYAYDVIPDSRAPLFNAYYYKGSDHRLISPQDLLSENTSLLDTVELLRRQDYFFVLHSNEICGYLHFSDLNKPIVKIPFYVMLEATERHLVNCLKGKNINDEELLSAIRTKYPDRAKALRKALEKSRLANTDLDLFSRLYFSDVLIAAVHYGVAKVDEREQLSDDQIETLNGLRNDVSHSGHELIASHKSVDRLIEVRKLCNWLRSFN